MSYSQADSFPHPGSNNPGGAPATSKGVGVFHLRLPRALPQVMRGQVSHAPQGEMAGEIPFPSPYLPGRRRRPRTGAAPPIWFAGLPPPVPLSAPGRRSRCPWGPPGSCAFRWPVDDGPLLKFPLVGPEGPRQAADRAPFRARVPRAAGRNLAEQAGHRLPRTWLSMPAVQGWPPSFPSLLAFAGRPRMKSKMPARSPP